MSSNYQHEKKRADNEDSGWDFPQPALFVLLCAVVVRVLGAGITTLTTLNPDSGADTVIFGNTAQAIARGIREGQPYLYTADSIKLSQVFMPIGPINIDLLWGSFLAPFWLLPGPSGFYARLGNALLGAFAIYNVYLIARYYHSQQAGIIAAIPLIFYPSIVAVQTTLLREAMVLFGITTAARLLILPTSLRSRLLTWVIAGGLLHVALLLRSDNIIIYAAAIATGLAVYAATQGYLTRRTVGIGLVASPIAFVLSLPVIQDGIEYLARIRELRASGRTVYLQDIIPQTVLEFIAFSWVGAAYFLYAPFPWMVTTIPDLLVSVEGLISIGFTIAAVRGIRSLGQDNTPATIGLIAGLLIAVILYGVGTVNYGTGMRHRQMFTWVIYLFGGIGLSEWVRFKLPFTQSSSRYS